MSRKIRNLKVCQNHKNFNAKLFATGWLGLNETNRRNERSRLESEGKCDQTKLRCKHERNWRKSDE